MFFRYIDGDFPPGTTGEQQGEILLLTWPKEGFFASPQKLELRGNIQTVEIIREDNRRTLPGRFGRFMNGGAALADQLVKKTGGAIVGGAIFGPLGAVVGVAISGIRRVSIICALTDGRGFCAEVSLQNYRILANEAFLGKAATRYRNVDFADATMALCALVASADGKTDKSEREQIEHLIISHELLKQFPEQELKKKFREYCRALRKNPIRGKMQVLETIAKLKNKPQQSRAMVHLGILIGETSGIFEDIEVEAVHEACRAVAIYPGEFGLYYTPALTSARI